jgi:hypothetical protein
MYIMIGYTKYETVNVGKLLFLIIFPFKSKYISLLIAIIKNILKASKAALITYEILRNVPRKYMDIWNGEVSITTSPPKL